MRTTVTLEKDAAAAVESLRRREGIGVSEAINQLIRAGLIEKPSERKYIHTSAPLGLKVDVSNVGDVLDLLDD